MSTNAPSMPKENVWDYPRVVWEGSNGDEVVIADTKSAYRVLETSHPPTYYFPPQDVKMEWLVRSSRSSFCEWKGQASYYHLQSPSSDAPLVRDRIWTYTRPTEGTRFEPIRGYLSFYASAGKTSGGEWHCYVGDERVIPQDGDFYGGWKTSWIEGKMKGGPGTWGW